MKRYALLLCLVPLALAAQSRLQFESVSYEQGLSHLSVNKIFQDSSGFVWFATVDGLYRYDGFKCKAFKHDPADSTSLPYNEVSIFFKLRDGNGFGIGTTKGASRYNPLAENFSPIEDVSELVSLGDYYHFSPFFIGDRDSAWTFVHKSKQLVKRLKSGEEKTYRDLFPNEERLLFYTLLKHDNKLWFASSVGLFAFDCETERMELYQRDPDNPASIPENSVRHAYVDREGNLWVATYGGGAALARLNRHPFKTFSHKPNEFNALPGGLLFGICEDRDGNLWIGSEHDGLCEFRRRDRRFIAHLCEPNNPKSPSENRYRALFCDSDGKIWANLSVFDPRAREWRRASVAPIEREAKAYVEIGDTVYVFANQTLYAVHRRSLEGRISKLDLLYPDNEARCCYRDRNGRLLVGTRNGFAELDLPSRSLRNWRFVNSPNVILHYGHVQTIYQTRDGRYWVGTRGGGLFVFGEKLETAENFSPRSGFPDNVVYDILEDDEGALWMTTNKGLIQFDPATNKALRVFGARDGLPNDEFNQHCFAKLRSGEFAGGGVGGLAIFNPKDLKAQAAPLSVVLTDFKIFEESQRLDSAIQFKRAIALTYAQNFFSFAFSALSFSNPKRVEYAYKLEGIDEHWIETRNNVARYNSVPDGEYLFRVKARFCNSDWGDERVIVVRVAPPFWKTAWFIAALSLALLTAMILSTRAFINRRIRDEVEKVKRQEEIKRAKETAVLAERERIAADVHDDVGAILTTIAIKAEALKWRPQGVNAEDLSGLANAAREATASISEIVWSMNPRYDTLDSFAAYLREKSRHLFESAPMELHIEIPDDLPDVALSGEMRHNLFLCAKEALNNALKHSGARHVWLSLAFERDSLSIAVQDDGKGFDGGSDFGNGLHTMRKRMENIGGACDVRSELGNGARIEFHVRLKRQSENGVAHRLNGSGNGSSNAMR